MTSLPVCAEACSDTVTVRCCYIIDTILGITSCGDIWDTVGAFRCCLPRRSLEEAILLTQKNLRIAENIVRPRYSVASITVNPRIYLISHPTKYGYVCFICILMKAPTVSSELTVR